LTRGQLGLDRGLVITAGRDRRFLGPDIEIVPWADVLSGAADVF
jgi:hypothetical protein